MEEPVGPAQIAYEIDLLVRKAIKDFAEWMSSDWQSSESSVPDNPSPVSPSSWREGWDECCQQAPLAAQAYLDEFPPC